MAEKRLDRQSSPERFYTELYRASAHAHQQSRLRSTCGLERQTAWSSVDLAVALARSPTGSYSARNRHQYQSCRELAPLGARPCRLENSQTSSTARRQISLFHHKGRSEDSPDRCNAPPSPAKFRKCQTAMSWSYDHVWFAVQPLRRTLSKTSHARLSASTEKDEMRITRRTSGRCEAPLESLPTLEWGISIPSKNQAGGRVVRGLQRRREYERNICLRGL